MQSRPALTSRRSPPGCLRSQGVTLYTFFRTISQQSVGLLCCATSCSENLASAGFDSTGDAMVLTCRLVATMIPTLDHREQTPSFRRMALECSRRSEGIARHCSHAQDTASLFELLANDVNHVVLARLERSTRVAALARFSRFAFSTDSYTFRVLRLIIMLVMSPSSGTSSGCGAALLVGGAPAAPAVRSPGVTCSPSGKCAFGKHDHSG